MIQPLPKLAIFIGLLLAGFSPASDSKAATNWKLTADRDYLPTLLGDLRSARKSVTVAMYLIQMDDPERHTLLKGLLDELIACQKRGVSVSVLAEASIPREDEPALRSAGALHYLAKGGVAVFTDNPATITHSKVVVIDESIVHLGSSNWTYSAFKKNHECNLRIQDPELARQLLETLSKQDRKPL